VNRTTILLIWLLASAGVCRAQLNYLAAEPPLRPDPVVAGMLKIRLTADAALNAPSVLAGMGLSIVRPLLPFQQSLHYRMQRDTTLAMSVNSVDRALEIESRLLRSFVVEYSNPLIPPERMIAMLHVGCGPIECAAPWCVMQPTSEPNDPQIDKQDLLRTIEAYAAWDIEPGSATIVIGISDSGLMQEHEDLRDALFVRKSEIADNGIDDDANGYIDDARGYNFCSAPEGSKPGDTFNPKSGHGTSVGGTCAATANNAIGIAGIAGACKIFPLRTMPDNSTGIVYGYESIMYCALNNISVVNCSWGGMSRSCIDEDVIAYTIARGTSVVAAAGNHGAPTPFYPASYRGVLGVGVTDAADNVIWMTGHGPTVDVMAPGHDSWSTGNDGGYVGFCCTSGSSPIASGVVALVRSKFPLLSPTQACALVRESVDERPWKTVPAEIDTLLLPRGRLNARLAVSALPDSVVSFVLDTVAISALSGNRRWTVGDTIQAEVRLTNTLTSWHIDERSPITLAGRAISGVRTISSGSEELDIAAKSGEFITLPPMLFVVEQQTDTSVYAVVELSGDGINGSKESRRFSFSITPSPAFTTLENQAMLVSIGDRGRMGNTDIQRGQGDGLRYQSFCGQLYEGGLMVHANGRVVDAIRSRRGVNDHFAPIKRFVRPEPNKGIIRDTDAPDSLRLGVEIEQVVRLDSVYAVLTLDISVTNVSDSTLHDLAVAWFHDWDLGTQPANNSTMNKATQGAHQGRRWITPGQPLQPSVVMVASSAYEDARAMSCGLDNTTTYGGFSVDMKAAIFSSPESAQYEGVNDVSTIVGMQFTQPVPPLHRRTFRLVIALDTSVKYANELADRAMKQAPWKDSALTIADGSAFPNPSESYVYVPMPLITRESSGNGSTLTANIYDVQGRRVRQWQFSNTAPIPVILTIDVREMAIGTYRLIVEASAGPFTSSFVVLR